MANDIILELFHNSPEIQELVGFFRTLYELTDASFIALKIDINTKNATLLSKNSLKKIHFEYKGRLTDESMQVGAFISSLYQLPNLQRNKPTAEWLFISKLCHLLLYSHIHTLPNRVKDICFIGRAWFNSESKYHKLISIVLRLQDNSLEVMYNQFEAETKQLKRSRNKMYNNVIKIERILDYVYNKRHQITRKSVSKRAKISKIDQPYIEAISLLNIDDAKNELVSLIHFDTTGNDIDIIRERLVDNIPDFVLLRESSIEKTEKYAPSLIYRRMNNNLQHANKNERLIAMNTRILPLFAIQDIFAKTWQSYSQENIDRTDTWMVR